MFRRVSILGIALLVIVFGASMANAEVRGVLVGALEAAIGLDESHDDGTDGRDAESQDEDPSGADEADLADEIVVSKPEDDEQIEAVEEDDADDDDEATDDDTPTSDTRQTEDTSGSTKHPDEDTAATEDTSGSTKNPDDDTADDATVDPETAETQPTVEPETEDADDDEKTVEQE